MLDPENSLINLSAVREEKEQQRKISRGRPKKSQDAIADERNSDLSFLQSKGLNFRRNHYEW